MGCIRLRGFIPGVEGGKNLIGCCGHPISVCFIAVQELVCQTGKVPLQKRGLCTLGGVGGGYYYLEGCWVWLGKFLMGGLILGKTRWQPWGSRDEEKKAIISVLL